VTLNGLIGQSLNLVIHLAHATDGTRVVTSVREVAGVDGSRVLSNEILRPAADGRAIPGAPPSTHLLDLLEAHGFDGALLDQPDGWNRP
jgi:hypothetical protein